MKISHYFDSFLTDLHRSGRKPSTINSHRINLDNTLSVAIGDIDLRDLRLSHANLVIDKAKDVGVSGPHQCIVTYRRLLRHIVGTGAKLKFDYREIEVPKYHVKADVQALDRGEIKQLRDALDTDLVTHSKHSCLEQRQAHEYTVLRTRCLLEFLLHTGLRISEALAVDIEDLDFEKDELRVRNAKTDTWDTVYLYGCVEYIHQYLKYRQDEHPALFLSNSGVRLPADTAKSALRRLKKRIVMKKSLSHKLFRSTFVTTLFRARRDPKEVQLLARHRSLQTTLDYYYKVEKEKLKPIHKAIMELL